MNIFIGCSSREEIDDKYKEFVLEITQEIAKIPNLDLVLGTANINTGLTETCYNQFKKNHKKILGITLNIYHDLTSFNLDKTIEVETTMDRMKMIYQKSDIFLFLPGGLKTYSEILTFLNEALEKHDDKMIIIYNKDFFFTPIIKELYFLYKKGFIKKNISEYCKIESEMKDILELIKEEENF